MHNKALSCAILTYDSLLFELSMSFINIEIDDVDFNIMHSLEKISAFLNADRAYLFTYDYTNKITTNTHEWCGQGIAPQIQNLQNIPIEMASEWIERHERGEIVFIENINELTSSPLKDVLLEQKIKSMVAIPMLYNGLCLGFVGFDFIKNYHSFNDEETKLFSLFAKLLVHVHDKIKIEKVLRDSEQHYRTLANGGMALIWTSGVDKLCNYFNKPWLDFTGRTMEQEFGNGWAQGVHPEDFDYCLDIYISHFDQRKPFSMEYRLKNYQNEYRWILDLGNPRYDVDGKFLGYIGYCYDITDRKHDEEALKTKTKELEIANNKLTLFSTVFTESCEGIIITSHNGICIDINESFVSLTGYDKSDIVGHNPSMLKSGHHSVDFYTKMWDDLKSNAYWQGEVWNRRKNGNLYVVQLSISAVKDKSGNTSHYVGIFHDITNIKEYQKNLEYLANYDALTSLPNRNLLLDRLKQSMAQTLRHQNLLGVVFIDLDGFKFINDTYGHDCGDRLLVTISNRLKLSLRGVDTIARLGGDEFVVLLSDLKNKEDSFHTLTRILQTINDEVLDNNNKLLISASLGVSFYPQQNKRIDFSGLIKQADKAMYQAKLQGKNRCMIYDDLKDAYVAPNAGFEPATK